MSETTHTLYKI